MNTRCGEPPVDIDPISTFEVLFGMPVFVSREDERALVEIIERIIKRPWNQPVDGVHWASGFGSRPNFSEVDAALLGRNPAPDDVRPKNGEEPTFDDSVYQIETCVRGFVSEKERDRVLKERGLLPCKETGGKDVE